MCVAVSVCSWSCTCSVLERVTNLVKNFVSIYWTSMFIGVITRAQHWSLASGTWIQSISWHPTTILCLQNCIFPSSCQAKILHAFLTSSMIRPFDSPNNTWTKVQIMKLVTVHVTPFPMAISNVTTISLDDRIHEWWIWRASKEMVLAYWRYYPSVSLEALRKKTPGL
jgi:hypothetical protein